MMHMTSFCEAEEKVVFYTSLIKGEKHVYSHSLSEVKKLPKWDMKGETPIPFYKAVRKAWDYAEKKYPGIDLFLEEVELDPSSYNETGKQDDGICWVYWFEFTDKKTYKRVSGKILMLMDSSIIEPVKEK